MNEYLRQVIMPEANARIGNKILIDQGQLRPAQAGRKVSGLIDDADLPFWLIFFPLCAPLLLSVSPRQ